MSRPAHRTLTLALLLAALPLAAPVRAADVTPAPKLTLGSLPEAARKTVRAESKGSVIRAILKEAGEDGRPVYEIEMTARGLTHDIVVGEDGTLLVSERQMTLAALPPAVRATMLKAAAGRRIRIVESVTRLGTLAFYEAHVGAARAPVEIQVAPDGTLVP